MLQFMPPPNDRNKKKGRGDDDDGEEGGEDDVSLLRMMTGFILCHQLDFFVVMNIVFLYVIFPLHINHDIIICVDCWDKVAHVAESYSEINFGV